MKILAISGNPKSEGALATLHDEATRGAAEAGAEVETIRLAEKDIGCCRFCLNCLEDTASDIAACVQKDDMAEILHKIKEADGFILSCPMSSGHINAHMKIFEERCVMTLCTPTKKILWVSGIPESRIGDKKRHAVTITTTGAIPNVLRPVFHGSTREMASMARDIFNAETVGNLYAGRLWFRKLSRREKKKAYKLGRSLVQAGG
ncbi:MAG: flavodoxin family protein [Actinobacteria bacterium]|nr:flavodoxin family protein [Actinomycetota bacterium]